MKKSAQTVLSVAAFAMALGLVNVSTSQAGQFKLFGSKIELAYAPQDNTTDNRFDQFDSEEDLHELNDAWLGMPAFSSEGTMIGFVEDAFLNDNGDITELLVSLSGKKIAVYVGGEHAELSDTKVAIAMTLTKIAGLERENGFQVTSR